MAVLYNSSGRAPSVVRNLRGELVFENGQAVACVLHRPIEDVFLNRRLRSRLQLLAPISRFPSLRVSRVS